MRMSYACLAAHLFVLLGFPGLVSSQDRPGNTEDIARAYSRKVQPIYDQVEQLRSQADNPSLSIREATQLIEQQRALRRQADEIWTSTQRQLDSSFRQASDKINQYNEENRRLDFESAIVGSQTDLLNNIGRYPKREQFEQNKEQLSRAWEQNYGSRLRSPGDDFDRNKKELFDRVKNTYGLDLNQTGYSRIGTINPYTGETYYKYYGPDGNLLAGQWQNDANGWKKWREDVQKSSRRQFDAQESIRQTANSLKKSSDQIDNMRSQVDRSGVALKNKFDRRKAQSEEPARSKTTNLAETSWKSIVRINNDKLYFNSDGTWERREFNKQSFNIEVVSSGRWKQDGATNVIITIDYLRGLRGGLKNSIQLRGEITNGNKLRIQRHEDFLLGTGVFEKE